GLAGPTPAGVRDVKIGHGTADMTTGPALSAQQVDAAITIGRELATELAGLGVDCLVLGEIGIGNTTAAAALTCMLTGPVPALAVGRGTGLDAAGLERKRAVVRAAVDVHGGRLPARDAIAAVGGFELAALGGAVDAAVSLRLPVVLDGYAVAAAALAAVRLEAVAREGLIASHRSAATGH